MSFYSVMQLNAASCKQLIHNTTDKKKRLKYQIAFFTKNLLCVLFAITFISIFSMVFHSSNSIPAVVIFCALLSLRSVDFGYDTKSSLYSLFAVFVIMTLGPAITAFTGPLLSFILNFGCIFILSLLTCHNVLYSNQSIYVFGYLLMTSVPVSGQDFYLRLAEMFVGFLLCAAVFYRNHRNYQYHRTFQNLLKEFNLGSLRSQWQLKLSLGIALALLIGQLLNLPRLMWIGFGALSVLQPFHQDTKKRLFERFPFIVIGSLCFFVVYQIVPASFHPLFGPLAGFLAGFCATYQYNTLINCFSALLVASSLYGLPEAVLLRILNNFIGCIFAYCFHLLFNKVATWIQNNHYSNELTEPCD